jgi:tRNA 2-thiouridine synthesizing protein A
MISSSARNVARPAEGAASVALETSTDRPEYSSSGTPEASRAAMPIEAPTARDCDDRGRAGQNRGVVMTATVDARGLSCPLPLALAKRRMAELKLGEQLVVLATDPEAPIDLGAWAADEGHGYAARPRDGYVEFTFIKGEQ